MTHESVGLREFEQPPEEYSAEFLRNFLAQLYENLEDITRMDDGEKFTRVAVAVSYAAKPTDSFIAVTNTSSARTITLPKNTNTIREVQRFVIKDESGAAGTNAITIDVEDSGTIDGLSSITVSNDYGYVAVYHDGAGNYFTAP